MMHFLSTRSGAVRLYVLTVVSAIIMTACTVSEPVTPRSGYAIVGATGASPNAPGWTREKLTSSTAVFVARGPNDGETSVARTEIYRGVPNSSQVSDRDLLAAITDVYFERGTGRYKFISNKRSSTHLNGKACEMFRIVAQDLKAPPGAGSGVLFMKAQGIACRHPKDDATMLVVDVSNRSNAKSFSAATQSAANQFFADIQFTENGLQ
ncbi:MAG: hypothetical protein ABJ360_20685 [Roseobacter sp.]|uniref:hypothetical protein n=1 Tax=Tateyamaria sp. TaxID=1929288 RepID=UPI003282E604